MSTDPLSQNASRVFSKEPRTSLPLSGQTFRNTKEFKQTWDAWKEVSLGLCNKWRHYYYYYHYYHRHYFASITPHRHSQTLSVKKFASLNVYIASGLLATKDRPLDDFQVQISWAQRTQDRRSIHQLIKEQQPPKLRRSEHRWSGQWQQWQHREPTSWLLSICYAQSNLWPLFCGLFQLIFATVIGAKRYPVPILN